MCRCTESYYPQQLLNHKQHAKGYAQQKEGIEENTIGFSGKVSTAKGKSIGSS